MSIEFVELHSREIRVIRHELERVYLAAFSLPPWNQDGTDVVRFNESIDRHTRSEGFRCIAAKESGGNVVGFGYGYTSKPGQWWHDIVDEGLGNANAHRWLGHAFELVELAIVPQLQGRGIGGKIHDLILKELPHATAVLSTFQSETRALRLYRKRGWVTLLWDFGFPGAAFPILVMGLDLSRNTSSLDRRTGLVRNSPKLHPRAH